MFQWRILLLCLLLSAPGSGLLASEIPEFRQSAWFGEQVREQWFEQGIRVHVNAPGNFDRRKPTRLLFFATPNGNSLEETMGRITEGKTDWRFDTQHVAAQVRRFREAACWPAATADAPTKRSTAVTIDGAKFLINGRPTYQGRTWNGHSIEGLLLNSRMVQATFDDRNPKTVTLWAYPDTKKWDPDRNTNECLAEMPGWRKHGLLAITLNLQGGSPQGYSQDQPWHNSALNEDGSLDAKYMARFARVIEKTDELGMVVILGIYYFGQDERLKGEAAVLAGVDATIDWVVAKKYTNVLIEINNECNVRYDHAILKPDRVHELIRRAKERSGAKKFPLLVGTSYGGNAVPKPNVVKASDFLLLHGNGVNDPARIGEMVRAARKVEGYRSMPILFNEDDHFDFDKPANNFAAAVAEYASWGYFDYRMKGEGFDEGYQSVPVNWKTSSVRKRGFFKLLSEMTGERP
jgi:hypothetical protein